MSRANNIFNRLQSISRWLGCARSDLFSLREEIKFTETMSSEDANNILTKRYGEVWESLQSLQGDVEMLGRAIKKAQLDYANRKG